MLCKCEISKTWAAKTQNNDKKNRHRSSGIVRSDVLSQIKLTKYKWIELEFSCKNRKRVSTKIVNDYEFELHISRFLRRKSLLLIQWISFEKYNFGRLYFKKKINEFVNWLDLISEFKYGQTNWWTHYASLYRKELFGAFHASSLANHNPCTSYIGNNESFW